MIKVHIGARRRQQPTERGLTLIEVVLTMALVVALSGAAFGTLDAFTRADRRLSAATEARQGLRQAIDELATVLRRGISVTSDSSSGAVALRVRYDDDLGSGDVELDASGSEVTRSLDGGERVVLVDRVVESEPVFTYFTAKGAPLDPNLVSGATIRSCAALVGVRLAVRPPGAMSPVVESRKIALRNFHQETQC